MGVSLENSSNLSFAEHAHVTKVLFHYVAREDILPYLNAKAAFSNLPSQGFTSHLPAYSVSRVQVSKISQYWGSY